MLKKNYLLRDECYKLKNFGKNLEWGTLFERTQLKFHKIYTKKTKGNRSKFNTLKIIGKMIVKPVNLFFVYRQNSYRFFKPKNRLKF